MLRRFAILTVLAAGCGSEGQGPDRTTSQQSSNLTEKCVFGETYSDIEKRLDVKFSMTVDETSLDDLRSYEKDQLVAAVRSATGLNDISDAADALGRVDSSEANFRVVVDTRGNKFRVFEFGLGDNSYGAILRDKSTSIAARIHDGDLMECNAFAPSGNHGSGKASKAIVGRVTGFAMGEFDPYVIGDACLVSLALGEEQVQARVLDLECELLSELEDVNGTTVLLGNLKRATSEEADILPELSEDALPYLKTTFKTKVRMLSSSESIGAIVDAAVQPLQGSTGDLAMRIDSYSAPSKVGKGLRDALAALTFNVEGLTDAYVYDSGIYEIYAEGEDTPAAYAVHVADANGSGFFGRVLAFDLTGKLVHESNDSGQDDGDFEEGSDE